MGGAIKSAGGFLGLGGGPEAPGGQFGNTGLSQLQEMNRGALAGQGALTNYALGRLDTGDVLNNDLGSAASNQGQINELATGPLTGSKFATEQVQNNPILGQLFGKDGQLSSEIGQYGKQSGLLDQLQNQGYELKPEDKTMYGQMAGDIARQFGQQGNQAANDLASRGLSSSGAAGAAFSGLAGNQNEMLAKAQQQIAQQRFQNTMNQIGQQQQFLSSLGGNINNMGNSGANAIQQQYGRQLAGVQNQTGQAGQTAGLQQGANNAQNSYGMQASQFNAANAPKNFMDFGTAGVGQAIESAGSNSGSLFGGTPGGSGANATGPMGTQPNAGPQKR